MIDYCVYDFEYTDAGTKILCVANNNYQPYIKDVFLQVYNKDAGSTLTVKFQVRRHGTFKTLFVFDGFPENVGDFIHHAFNGPLALDKGDGSTATVQIVIDGTSTDFKVNGSCVGAQEE